MNLKVTYFSCYSCHHIANDKLIDKLMEMFKDVICFPIVQKYKISLNVSVLL